MRNYLFLTGLAAVALTTSCSEDFDLLGNKHEVTLSASVTAEGTRAAFKLEGNTAKFYWNTDDKIGVTSTGNTTSFSSFTLQGVGGSATANFSGTVSGEVTNASYAVYPYNAGHSMSESTLSYVFPSEYTYTKVSPDFFPGTADCNSFNPAMWAKVGSDKSISFKHLGGIFVIKFGSMPLTEGKLVLSADQQMAGTFTAKLSSNEDIVCSNEESSVTNSSTKVTINFSGATKDADGVFYVPVPVGTYNNVFVELYETGGTKALRTVAAGSFTVTRKLLQPLKLNSETVSGGEATTAETAAAATTALESNDNVSITNLVSDGTTAEGESGTVSATITIPAVTTTTTEETVAENTQKTVAVEKIPEKAVITLADAKTTTSESDEKKASVESVVLSIPHMAASTDDDKAKLPTVNVTMPNTTVTLAGNAGTANFGTVTAETAENTLVVSSGVTIQKLVVKKGNVRIESGATVVTIEKDASYTGTPIIYYEEGASIPTGITGFNMTKLSFIDTESDFATAISSDGACMLTKNLTLTKGYTVSKNVSIDLNGKTLTAKALGANTNGTMTLKNGKLVQDNGNATITIKSDSPLAIAANEYIIDGHEFVDLGLSVLWATMNVGATTSTDYGKYYAWGEVTAYGEATDWGDKAEKTNYDWTTYKHCNGAYSSITKYKTGEMFLEAEDDAATVNWGSDCRMPTGAEMYEIINKNATNCSWKWTTENGINGYVVTSLKEGYTDKAIFLPASGSREKDAFISIGKYGAYWSGTLSSSKIGFNFGYAYSIIFSNTSNKATRSSDFRNYGYPVRPVAVKPE